MKETEKVFMNKIEFISRKGVYPYDYMSNIKKFNLPPKKKLYS